MTQTHTWPRCKYQTHWKKSRQKVKSQVSRHNPELKAGYQNSNQRNQIQIENTTRHCTNDLIYPRRFWHLPRELLLHQPYALQLVLPRSSSLPRHFLRRRELGLRQACIRLGGEAVTRLSRKGLIRQKGQITRSGWKSAKLTSLLDSCTLGHFCNVL